MLSVIQIILIVIRNLIIFTFFNWSQKCKFVMREKRSISGANQKTVNLLTIRPDKTGMALTWLPAGYLSSYPPKETQAVCPCGAHLESHQRQFHLLTAILDVSIVLNNISKGSTCNYRLTHDTKLKPPFPYWLSSPISPDNIIIIYRNTTHISVGKMFYVQFTWT